MNIMNDGDIPAPIMPESSSKLEGILKNSYDTELSRKELLDDKANSMMGIAATVATLYGGFGLAITTNLFSDQVTLNPPVVILIMGVILLVFSIFVSAKSYHIRKYHYAGNYNKFVTFENNQVTYNEEEIRNFRYKSELDFNLLMIKSYLSCIVRNHKYNENKAKDLGASQLIFFAGLITVPLFVIFTTL